MACLTVELFRICFRKWPTYIRPAYKFVAVRTTTTARGQCAPRYLSCVYHVIKWDFAKSFHSLLKYGKYLYVYMYCILHTWLKYSWRQIYKVISLASKSCDPRTNQWQSKESCWNLFLWHHCHKDEDSLKSNTNACFFPTAAI